MNFELQMISETVRAIFSELSGRTLVFQITLYGTILTAWPAAGIVGPQLVAFIKDHYADQAGRLTFSVAALLLLVGTVLSLLLHPRRVGSRLP